MQFLRLLYPDKTNIWGKTWNIIAAFCSYSQTKGLKLLAEHWWNLISSSWTVYTLLLWLSRSDSDPYMKYELVGQVQCVTCIKLKISVGILQQIKTKVFLVSHFYIFKNKMLWIILCNMKCFIFELSNVWLMLFCCRSRWVKLLTALRSSYTWS